MKIKKIAALSIGLVMTVALFTGCSTDGLVLMNAFGKSKTINSLQTQTNISLKVSGTNMSVQEQQMLGTMLPMVNGTKISILTKTNQNKEKTIGKVQSDIALQLGQFPQPISMSVWADTDITGDEPIVNEVIKIPKLMGTQLPMELQGKDYMVMNLSDMTNAPGMIQPNYKNLISFSKEFQPKFLDFIAKYAKQFNPTTDYIKHVGSQSFLENNKMQSTDTYEVKLTDKSFKDLMHYTLNNLAGNTDAMNFVKDYMSAISSVYGIKNVENKTTQDEINKAFGDLTTQLPQQLLGLNKTLDSIENLKILGDNGITIKYTVNDEGYIIKEKGNAEFVVDLPSISKLASNSVAVSSPSDPTGIYTIGISFDTDMTNINKEVNINAPTVNSSNSFNYTDLLKLSSKELSAK